MRTAAMLTDKLTQTTFGETAKRRGPACAIYFRMSAFVGKADITFCSAYVR